MGPLRIAHGFSILLLLAGCSTAELVESDESWPLEWRGRALYQHRGQLAFATSGGAAAEICTLAAEVAEDFRTITGAEPAELIHVAVDAGDPSLVTDADREFVQFLTETREVLGDAALEEGIDLPASEWEEHGLRAELLIAIMPLVLYTGTLSPEQRGEPTVRYSSLLSTEDSIADGVDILVDIGMKKAEVSRWKRVLIAPVLHFAKRKMRGMIVKVTRYTLFRLHTIAKDDWTDEMRAKYLAIYREELGLDEAPSGGPPGIALPGGAGSRSVPVPSSSRGRPGATP